MALALSLVGQPVQPYLTTGATDFVNSVQKGKEDAIKTEELKTQSQKSALDLLSAKKKIDESAWATTNANDLKARADKGDLDAASIARMNEANPEFAKLLGTAQADAVKNFYASNLIGLNSATDQAGFLNDLVQAHDAHNAPLPESVRRDPKLAIQYYKMLLNGAKAFDDKTASMDESGNVITKDALGNTTAINPAAVKAAKAVPVIENGKEVIRPVNLGNGKTRTERKLSDGTWENLGESSQKDVKPIEEPAPEFSEAAINNAAARYNIDGTLPPMGMGKGGATARSLILNRAAELAGNTSGTDQRVAQLTTKADTSTLLQLRKTKTMIKAFEEMANKNADIALEMSDKVDRSGTPVVNRWFLAANNKIAGDVDTATFNTAVNVFVNEYAKIMSGSMGNTPVSDSARKEAHEILNTAQTPAQLRANIKLLQREMQNRIKGLDDSERELLKGMRGSSSDAKKDEGKKPTGNQVKQPQTPYEWYVLHWNDAQKKGDKVRMQRLTEEAKKMGIAK